MTGLVKKHWYHPPFQSSGSYSDLPFHLYNPRHKQFWTLLPQKFLERLKPRPIQIKGWAGVCKVNDYLMGQLHLPETETVG